MLKNLSHYTLSFIYINILSFLTIPIFTRYLTPADYGVLAIFGMFGSIITNIFSVGLLSVSIVFYHKLDFSFFKSLNFTNFIFLFFSFFVGLLLVYISEDFIVKNIFNDSINKNILYLSYFYSCLYRFYFYFYQQLIQQKRSRLYLIFSILFNTTVTISALILLVIYSQGLFSRIYSGIFSLILFAPLIFLFNLKYLSFEFSFKKLFKSIKFSYPYISGTIIGSINDSFDKTMLNNFKGKSELGQYHIAQQFSSMTKEIMNLINQIWSPFFFENASKSNDTKKQNIIEKYYEIICFFNYIAVIISCFCHEIIILLTTEQYYFSAFLIPIFIASYLFASMVGSLSKLQLMISEKLIYSVYSSVLFVIIKIK